MFQDKFVFAKLVSFLDRSKFNRIVAKYNGDRYVKHLTCWNQFLAMMFGLHFLGTATPVQSTIISALRNIVVDRLTGSNKDYSTTLLDIVNTLRSHPEEFPQWHTSPTAALFTPPIFENKKENKGYWF